MLSVLDLALRNAALTVALARLSGTSTKHAEFRRLAGTSEDEGAAVAGSSDAAAAVLSPEQISEVRNELLASSAALLGPEASPRLDGISDAQVGELAA